MKTFFTNQIETLIAYVFGAGGLFTAVVERRKRKADAVTSMQELYARFVIDSEKKFVGFQKEITLLKEQIKSVEAYGKKKYDALKQEFETYKKTHP